MLKQFYCLLNMNEYDISEKNELLVHSLDDAVLLLITSLSTGLLYKLKDFFSTLDFHLAPGVR